MAKKWTEEERKAFGEKMRAARQAKEPVAKAQELIATKTEVSNAPTTEELQRQINQLMESNALLTAAFLNGNKQAANGINLGKGGQIQGEVEKYLIDPSNYPDPTPRLAAEKRLQPLAFNHNYELTYDVSVVNYETKTGVSMKEPNFLIQLNRIVLDDQGEPTNKRYIARRYIFKEDPQAALILARQNNLDIDKSDERAFLNEMRYIRARDWLFSVFWPKSEVKNSEIREEVIGGQLVQVFTKNSENPTSVDFDKLTKKMV